MPKMSYETYSFRCGSLSKEIQDVADQITRAKFTSIDPPAKVTGLLRKHARLQERQAKLTRTYIDQSRKKAPN